MRSPRSSAVRAAVVAAVLSAATVLAAPAQAKPAESPETTATAAVTMTAYRFQYANVATGKCLDIRGASRYEYGLLQQFNCKEELHQEFWSDTVLGDPSVDLKPAHVSNLCLEPSGLEAGATIVQRVCNYSQGQRWDFGWNGSSATVKNRVSGLCLEDAGMPSGSRREVRQMPCTGAPGQLWSNR
ncbi:Endo-1,4-beta-xylanase A precursor [Streptomyces sp. ADI91-18]|uniref:RICIN domain-containing protein n=1 Tax=Streptomyces sp. ADI91-18 TaxID=1522755 RepID=UPI000F54CA42|nr:RICIN domain-containing protein [Streptomyces sp. ADI91-18]RPK41932.1 Endo-1,4-beta-xylanase A precursor [Streptomyces sp. ADI91-18]